MISQSCATGAVNGFGAYGGLVGVNDVGATITGSHAAGAVTTPTDNTLSAAWRELMAAR
jgi:hypothetical protein